ncbi:hypothetical protein M514_11037 [Trichuris suis]|uniref:Peptidase A2 domain-containing protein n=1 Tax=Trichuris suis TaxID=68888 RepID=A0A085MW66_9BILA|nr:hypothetical protein M514_11037 [Trichuris suis]
MLNVDGTVGDKELSMLVDSGSAVTLIHQDVYRNWQDPPHLTATACSILAANGTTIPTVGVCEVPFRFAKTTIRHRVYIVDGIPLDCVIGADFLLEHGCVIDASQRIMMIGGETVLLRCGSTTPVSADPEPVFGYIREKEDPVLAGHRKQTVVSHETVIVPPRCEMLVVGRFEDDGSRASADPSCCWLMEPSIRLAERGLIAARAFAKIKDGHFPVRLMNLADAPVSLYESTALGLLSETVIDEDLTSPNSIEQHAVYSALMDSLLPRPVRREDDFQMLLKEYSDIFGDGDNLGCTDVVQHQMDTGNAKPCKQPPRRIPFHQRHAVEEETRRMLRQGIIEPAHGPWACPVVLVRKKDGSFRFCVDYRKLNDVTHKDAHPLPRIDDTLLSLGGAQWFSTLDLASGF